MVKTKKLMILSALLTTLTLSTTIAVGAFNNEEVEDSINLPSFYNSQEYFKSNKYTNYYPNNNSEPNVILESGDELVCQKKIGKYYLNKEDLSFKLEMNDGYIHSSKVTRRNMNNVNRPLNSFNYAKSRSAIAIKYFDLKNDNLTPQEETLYKADEDLMPVKNASIDLEVLEDGYNAKILFETSKIELEFKVKFLDEGLKVSIPYESIKHHDERFALASVSIYDFFGAVGKDKKETASDKKVGDNVDGYNFVADGVGALVRYEDIDSNFAPSDYRKRVYGNDEALPRTSVSESLSQISMPVFGYVHGENENGMVAIVENGDEYCYINATHAQNNMLFYRIYPEFIYRTTYNQPTNNTGGSISLVQKASNVFDIDITYKFLKGDEANYVGMAKEYKKYLLANDSLHQNDKKLETIPMRVETIGNEVSKGNLFKKHIVMTKFSEFNSMVNEIKDFTENQNIVGVVKGYSKNGTTWASPNYVKFSKKLGSYEDIEDLENTYFYLDHVRVSSTQNGYNARKDLAKKINTQIISKDENADVKYYFNSNFTKKLMKKDIEKLAKKGINNLALDSIGYVINSDFGKDKKGREESSNDYLENLSSLNNAALYSPNAYALKYTSKHFDYSMYNNQYNIFDDCVPFTSIVQSGNVELYSTPINFFGNVRDDLLRMIDFNVYPSFILTDKSSSLLQKTSLQYIYSSRYEDFKEAIDVYYDFVNEPLKEVYGEEIIERQILMDGVTKVKYSNNKTIYINYTNNDVHIDGIDISKKGVSVR